MLPSPISAQEKELPVTTETADVAGVAPLMFETRIGEEV
jgi:hypothetical protein